MSLKYLVDVWHRIKTRLSWLKPRHARKQQQRIQSLQEEIEHLKLTAEARILERTEELRVKARQMALVEQAGQRFASILDPELLLKETARTLREDFGYFTAALYMLEGGLLRLSALATADETVQQQVGQNIYVQPQAIQELPRDGRPMSQDDLLKQSHPLGLPRLGRGRSSMTTLLTASNQMLGALDLQSPLSKHFDEDDALVLHMLATRVAVALELSRLYRQEQLARQRADAMAVLARVVTTSLELDRVLSLGLDQLRRVLAYDAAVILLLEEGQVIPAAVSGLPERASHSLGTLFNSAHRRGLTRLLERGEPLLATLLGEPGEEIPPELASHTSWLAVPLTSRGTILGAVFVASQEEQAYDQRHLRTAEDFAGQVSTAIDNARLYGRIRRERDRLETLYKITQELNTDLEIERLLLDILEQAQESIGGVAGSLILLDQIGRPTHSILSRYEPRSDELLQKVLTDGAAGWALRQKEGLVIRDTYRDRRWCILPDDPWSTRSAIVVPLLSRDQVIGILTVVHPQVGQFGQDDLDLLTSIAGQASAAVQRANLFAAIREERARLEAVIEGTADAVIVLDEAGKILHINRSAANLLQVAGDSVLEQEVFHVVEFSALRMLPQQLQAPYTQSQAEIPFGEKTFYATLTPIPDIGAVITMQDISYLKELDRMKSEFVATVSHDLRTPLGAVRGFAEMLEVAGPLNQDQDAFAHRIIHTVDSMSGLVEDLLDLAKIEAGVEMDMAPCQIAAVIAEVVDQIAGPETKRGISLQIEVPDDLPRVWGNGRRLGQVVGNLLDNAIKYAPKGSEILLQARQEGTEVQITVSDQGPGIPTDDLPRVFDKFFHQDRHEQDTPGTGLGLSIAHSIIQAHRGHIWVESTEGEGATFSFCIPCYGE